MRRTKTAALLAALALCTGLLTACGDKKNEEAQATTAVRTTESIVATQSADTKAGTTTAEPVEAESTAAPAETELGKLFPDGETPSFTLPLSTGENGGSDTETQPTQASQPSQPTQPGDSTSPTQERPASGENLILVDSNENLPAKP